MYFPFLSCTRSSLLINRKDLLDDAWKSDPQIVFIGRPSCWGNPYNVARYGRLIAIAKYEEYLTNTAELINNIQTLRNKRLLCYCFPKSCHGDVLLKYIYAENLVS